MAVQIDSANVSGINYGYGNPRTLSNVVVADNPNRMLLVFCVHRDAGNPTGVTYGGASMTYVGSMLGDVYLYYMASPTVGTADVVVSFTGGYAGRIFAATLYNCKQSDFIRNTDQIYNSGDGTTVFNPSVTTVAGDMTLIVADGAITTITVDAGATEEDTGADFTNSLFSKPATSTTTTVEVTYSNNATIKNIEMYSLQEAITGVINYKKMSLKGRAKLSKVRI
jgi:hypothetical protein